MNGHAAGLVMKACVEGRLSATRLVFWKFDGDVEALEQMNDRFTDVRGERVHETGDE
jgi:hypothetical protein